MSRFSMFTTKLSSAAAAGLVPSLCCKPWFLSLHFYDWKFYKGQKYLVKTIHYLSKDTRTF